MKTPTTPAELTQIVRQRTDNFTTEEMNTILSTILSWSLEDIKVAFEPMSSCNQQELCDKNNGHTCLAFRESTKQLMTYLSKADELWEHLSPMLGFRV